MNHDITHINKLILQLSHNNGGALDELYALTKEKMKMVALRYLQDKSYVEDVLSEAFLKIYNKSYSFKKSYNGYNWMYEIVKNTALDYNRKNSKTTNMSFDEDIFVNDVGISYSQNINLHIALKSLNAIELQVIQLRIWENNSLNEIAELLKMNMTRIYRIYNSALKKLYDNLLV
ncbi:MAG: sigma-70 family RNA polymerase sigma factor [Anaeroplasmataceae bacterium]|nr:sigma-70 family RNA polymerase sigma factor [Anaeroplasmataceae bacterium]